MILTGLYYEEACLFVPTPYFHPTKESYFFESKDIHEAARGTWNVFHNIGVSICRELLIAEFHDTETRKTWSVDDCGHTKRDYRVEKTEDFISRWKQKEEPKNDFDVWTFD